MPRRGGRDGKGQWGDRAIERQYRDRLKSRRLAVFAEGNEMDNIWYAGVDWASEKHDIWLTHSNGKFIGKKTFSHGGEGLAGMSAWLLEKTKGRPDQIHIAIETSRGPVVDTLLDYSFNVYAINPKQLDRFRDRFTLAGAKDDSRDSETMAVTLRTDPRAFRKLENGDAVLVELREVSRMIDTLTKEKIRLANRLREQLWRYYPQVIELCDETDAAWVAAVWKAAPTPADAAALDGAAVAKILKEHRIRRIGAEEVLAILRAQPLTTAPGVVEAAQAHVRLLCEYIDITRRQLKDMEKRRKELLAVLLKPVVTEEQKPELETPPESQPEPEPQQELEPQPAPEPEAKPTPERKPEPSDAAILKSIPGVGDSVLATLLTEAADGLQRRECRALRALSGSAPVTKRSGKSIFVVRRLACHPRVRTAVYHWANIARLHDETCKAKYQALKARGHNHARALRSIGAYLLYIACALLKKGVLYDPAYAKSKPLKAT